MNLSPEERLRRSEQAKKQVAEGKLGGKQKGQGRPKQARAQEHVAAEIRNDAQKIISALRSALKAESPSIKLKAALAMLEIERSETDYQDHQEQRKYDNMDRGKILELIEKRIAQLNTAGVKVPGFDFESTASEVLDEPPKELDG